MRRSNAFFAGFALFLVTVIACGVRARKVGREFVSEYDGHRTVHHEWFGVVFSVDRAAPGLKVSEDLRRELKDAFLKLPKAFVVEGEPVRQRDASGPSYYLRGRFVGPAADVVSPVARQLAHAHRTTDAKFDRVAGTTRDGRHELEFCTAIEGSKAVATLNVWPRRGAVLP